MNNYQQEKKTCFYKIIHICMQFSANVNRFIVKAKLTFIFTNDLKRKYFSLEMFIIVDLVTLDDVYFVEYNKANSFDTPILEFDLRITCCVVSYKIDDARDYIILE